MNKTQWLDWAKEIQTIAQNGLAYTENPFDRERYERLRAISVEILNNYTDISTEKLTALFAGETGYQTPKVDVRGAVVIDGRILLVKERIGGGWSLPGGWADTGLSVKQNVAKEMREEAGLLVRPKRLVAVYDWLKDRPDAPFSMYKIVMLCQSLGGVFVPNDETEEARYFAPDQLPELSHKVSPEMIELCIKADRYYEFEPVID